MATNNDYKLGESIKAVMMDWAGQTIAQFKSTLEANDLVASGQLRDSLDFFVSGSEDEIAAKIQIYFETYGRYNDMRYQYKAPPTGAMYDFVKKTGLDKFEYVPGYPKGVSPLNVSAKSRKLDNEEYVMKRIARAIAYSRLKPDWQSQKQKQWYNVTIKKTIGKLKAMIRTRLETELAQTIREEFNLAAK